jgi:hypothetical protein
MVGLWGNMLPARMELSARCDVGRGVCVVVTADIMRPCVRIVVAPRGRCEVRRCCEARAIPQHKPRNDMLRVQL